MHDATSGGWKTWWIGRLQSACIPSVAFSFINIASFWQYNLTGTDLSSWIWCQFGRQLLHPHNVQTLVCDGRKEVY